MATNVLPADSEFSAYTIQVQMDGESYSLRFRWNTRSTAWYADVYDADGAALLTGRRLTIDSPLFLQHHARSVPPGEIVLQDTTNRKEPPGLDELGDRVLALYVEAADLA